VKSKLSKKQLAEALGVSPPAFSRYVRAGCPVNSVSAARAWQQANVNPVQRILQHAGRVAPADPIAEVHRLMALAETDFDAHAEQLRAVLRAVPMHARPGLLLNLDVMTRLLPHGLVDQLGGGCVAPDDDADREYVAAVLYGMAAGELVWK
jgi:transcriptional regulator with XRE-family HTH domain